MARNARGKNYTAALYTRGTTAADSNTARTSRQAVSPPSFYVRAVRDLSNPRTAITET
ncbi:MAG TPA: hypothetical protein VNR20_01615 [Terriglobales bacterium]|nr:hypothetical protein [Terriglobales bacterium]